MKKILTVLFLLFSLATLNAQFKAETYVHVLDENQDTLTIYFSSNAVYSTDYTPDMTKYSPPRTIVPIRSSYTETLGNMKRYVYKTRAKAQDIYVYLGLYDLPTLIVSGNYTYKVIQDY
jgi:hypothetical protein